ncbi:MAG: periplasmic protein TonB [Hyphomicrobiales bacterium]|jgi:protein TonB|nr:periplasmic protein TonB [Hyphomicrobiales bacterium]
MTKVSVGEIIALRPGRDRVDDLLGAVVPARPEHPRPANGTGTDPGNVVPFMRPGGERAAPAVALPAGTARLARADLMRERARLAAFGTVSMAVHAALFVAFWREPPPLTSIGVEVISVEIVVGATALAGIATTPSEQQVNSAAAPDTEATDTDKAEEKATAQPQTVEVAREESAPEQKTEQPKAREAKPDEPKFEIAAAPQEPARAEQKPAVAMVEAPAPDTATAKPQETPPSPTAVTLLPQPEEKPDEKKPEANPVQAAPPKPVKDAKPAKEQRRIAAPTRENSSREAKASTPSTAANNVGVGRSDNSSNYSGLVSAHLRRHHQYPSDARSRGDQGTATVSFGLDGGGRVTSARLVSGSGIASIDQEVQAMVRRASPFPAPPGGRAQSFTVPVSFRLN